VRLSVETFDALLLIHIARRPETQQSPLGAAPLKGVGAGNGNNG
jgi:hypothetical protein